MGAPAEAERVEEQAAEVTAAAETAAAGCEKTWPARFTHVFQMRRPRILPTK